MTVRGVSRAGDPLLSVDGSLIAAELMDLLYGACLVGHPAPKVAAMYEQLSHPVPGNRVVVFDAIFRDDDIKWKGTGYLLKIQNTKREGRVYYIQYGPEPVDVCRWSNCSVLAIPNLR